MPTTDIFPASDWFAGIVWLLQKGLNGLSKIVGQPFGYPWFYYRLSRLFEYLFAQRNGKIKFATLSIFTRCPHHALMQCHQSPGNTEAEASAFVLTNSTEVYLDELVKDRAEILLLYSYSWVFHANLCKYGWLPGFTTPLRGPGGYSDPSLIGALDRIG